ncbi:MAG: hypothetical protein ACOYOK_08965 [Pseudobdellovibrionaceae bacterium]
MQMMKKLNLIMIIFFLFSRSYAEDLKAGHRYKIIKPIYLAAWYKDLGNKKINKEAADAYLAVSKNADRPYIGFQAEVPTGTVMTIIGPAPKPWYLYFQGDIYFIKLEPDLSQGLDIKLQLDRWMEGNLDGLNPEIFSRM